MVRPLSAPSKSAAVRRPPPLPMLTPTSDSSARVNEMPPAQQLARLATYLHPESFQHEQGGPQPPAQLRAESRLCNLRNLPGFAARQSTLRILRWSAERTRVGAIGVVVDEEEAHGERQRRVHVVEAQHGRAGVQLACAAAAFLSSLQIFKILWAITDVCTSAWQPTGSFCNASQRTAWEPADKCVGRDHGC